MRPTSGLTFGGRYQLSSRVAIRPNTGRRPAFTRSPSRPSSAGRKVSAVATDVRPTVIAPVARLRMIALGTSSSSRDQVIVLEYDQNERLGWVFTQLGDNTFALDFRVRHRF